LPATLYVRRSKRGRKFPPPVSFGAVTVERDDGGLHFHISGDPPDDNEGSWSAEGISFDAKQGTLNLHIPLRLHMGVSRGLHKIALEAVAWRWGRRAALHGVFDVARHYVLKGSSGFRPLLQLAPRQIKEVAMMPAGAGHTIAHLTGADGKNHGMVVRLCGMVFAVSLHPEREAILGLGRRFVREYGARSCVAYNQNGIPFTP
jgi:hypothetical protein